MDEKTLENLKTILSSNSNLLSDITSLLTENNTEKIRINNENAEKTQGMLMKNKKEELIRCLLPYLDEKSKKTADYVLAAIRISEIITELKNKYS